MKKILLFMGDAAILYAALATTLIIRYGDRFGEQLDFHLLPFSVIFVVWLLVFYISNLYEIGFAKNNLPFFTALFYAIAANAVISTFFFYLVPLFGIAPKTNLFIFLGFAFALFNIWRRYYNRVIAQSRLQNNALIVGRNPRAEDLHSFLKNNPQLGYRGLGVLDTADKNAVAVLGDLIVEKKIQTVIISPEAYRVSDIIDVFYRLLGRGIDFYTLADFYERTTGRIPLDSIDQLWFLDNLSQSGRKYYEFTKRVADVVFAFAIGLVALILAPIIALIIKLDSPGPVFYRQKRIGRAGRIFELVKFRTMRADAEKHGPAWAKIDDPRITRIGKFLRRTRLDELPQAWNVLKGDMSFVGPRPERPEFHERLKKEIPFYEERYLIKPGLTGWAQIRYKLDFKGMTVDDTMQKLQYDLYYVKNRSVPLDIGIVLKTISRILRSPGT